MESLEMPSRCANWSAVLTIWIFFHEWDRIGTVRLENADRSRRTDAMTLFFGQLCNCLQSFVARPPRFSTVPGRWRAAFRRQFLISPFSDVPDGTFN
jgi:hypothetical protein